MKSNRNLVTSPLLMRRILGWLVLIGATSFYLQSQVIFAGPISPTKDEFGNVTWPGPLIDPTVKTIEDSIPGEDQHKLLHFPNVLSGTIEFYWSDGDKIDRNRSRVESDKCAVRNRGPSNSRVSGHPLASRPSYAPTKTR
jgi:hypothetical protein